MKVEVGLLPRQVLVDAMPQLVGQRRNIPQLVGPVHQDVGVDRRNGAGTERPTPLVRPHLGINPAPLKKQARHLLHPGVKPGERLEHRLPPLFEPATRQVRDDRCVLVVRDQLGQPQQPGFQPVIAVGDSIVRLGHLQHPVDHPGRHFIRQVPAVHRPRVPADRIVQRMILGDRVQDRREHQFMPGQLIEQALLCGLATVAIGVVRDRQNLRRVHFPGFAPVFEAVADRRDKLVEQVGPRRPGREGLLVEQQFLGFRPGVGAIAAGRQQVVLVVGQFGCPGEPGGDGVVHRQPLEIEERQLVLPLDQLLADAVFQPAARVAGGVGRGDQPGVRSQPTHQFADRLVLGEAVAQQGGCQVGTGEEAPIALGEAATAIGQPSEVGLDPGVVHPVVEVRQVPRDATGRFRHEGSASRKWIGMSGVQGSRFRPELGVNRPRPSSGKPIVRRNLGFCHHSRVKTALPNGRPILTIGTIAADAAARQPPNRR